MRYKERKFRYANWIDRNWSINLILGVTCFNKLSALCNPTSPYIQSVSKVLGKISSVNPIYRVCLKYLENFKSEFFT